MRRYEINTWGSWYKNSNNAAFKAPADADRIYEQNGFTVLRLPNVAFLDKIRLGVIYRIMYMLFVVFKISKKSEIHIQVTGSRITKYLIRYVRYRTNNMVLLIHDVNFLRYGDSTKMNEEVALYNLADEIIVHTPSMAEALKKSGVRVPMRILMLFDYLISSNKEAYAESDINTIVFAGNFQKSFFIKPLIQNSINWNVKFYFYGKEQLPEMENQLHTCYKGVFAPDDILHIEGAWGLVWDGNDLSTCDPYLKYNSPHKLSLYLAANKPVVIWRQSALYDFVKENKLGIALDSLYEIPDKISKITKEQYIEYVNSVRIISEKLKKGSYLSTQILS